MAIAREQIVSEALALLDEVGIDKLTTRKLADRLNVQQPALYWHFKNKRALLDAMMEDMLERHLDAALPQAATGWRTFLWSYAQGFRKALLFHRDGARVYSGAPPTDRQIGLSEERLRMLQDWGLSIPLAMQAVLTLNSFVLGSVLDEQADIENEVGWDRTSPYTPKVEHETLSIGLEAVRQGGRQAVFDAGLDMLLSGLALRLEPV